MIRQRTAVLKFLLPRPEMLCCENFIKFIASDNNIRDSPFGNRFEVISNRFTNSSRNCCFILNE